MNHDLLDPILRQLALASRTLPDPRPRPKLIDLGMGWLCGAAHPRQAKVWCAGGAAGFFVSDTEAACSCLRLATSFPLLF